MAVKLAAGSETAREREKRGRLSRQPLLAGCSPLTVRRVAAIADEITARPGDVLVQQGRHVFWFFLIQQGRADVVQDGSTIAQLRSGEYFGEVVLERAGIQPATIIATTPMRLFVIGSQRFVPLAHDVRHLRRRLHVVQVRKRHRVRPLRRLRAFCTRDPRRRRLVVASAPSRRRRVPLGFGVVTALLAAAAFYHPPLAVIGPGPSFDVGHDIVITGISASPPRGEYLVTTVTSARPSLVGLLATTFRANRHIVPASRVTPPSPQRQRARRRQAALFRESRVLAAAAAARSAGLPVVAAATSASDVPVHLPFEIRFRARRVVGPSAGLAYALAVADMLRPDDLVRGRRVAVTGEISADGQVQMVSYLEEKAAAAHHAGARLFIVPGAQAYAAAGHGMTVDGVSSLDDAIAALLAR